MLLNLENLFEKYNLKINGVIHVGAHFGEEHNTYKKLGINKIVYFEPIKKTFSKLSENIKDAQLYNFAIGASNTFLEMYVEADDKYGCSSILKPSSNYNPQLFSGRELVEVRTIDSFKFIGYNFLNIDVQGYELEVLKGAKDTLNDVDYIMCELNRNTTSKNLDYIDSALFGEIVDFLSNYGFLLVEEDWSGISWGDGFFIKK